MTLKLIPAPVRQLRTYSMLLIIATGVFDLAVVLIKTLTDAHVIGAETALIINAGMMFAVGVVRLIQQQVPISTEEKKDLIEQAAGQPMKPGEADVDVNVVQVPAPKIAATSVRAYIDSALDERFSSFDQRLQEVSRVLDELAGVTK